MLSKYDDVIIINLDALTYAGSLDNLKDIAAVHSKRYRFIKGDIADRGLVDDIFREGLSHVVNFAAETHVDRSIASPGIFVRSNIQGVQTLLDAALVHGIESFIQISTDEVYGSLQAGSFTEESPLNPSSPYSASKAGGELLARAYHTTFGLPVIVTRCSNNYGPCQHPEKLIPRLMLNAMQDRELPIYGDGLNIRDWLYVEDHCSAIDLVMRHGKKGAVYNIGGGCEKTNLEVARWILKRLGKPKSLIRFVPDRPGHDRRYSIDCSKLKRDLGWEPRIGFDEGMEKTFQWYSLNLDRLQ